MDLVSDSASLWLEAFGLINIQDYKGAEKKLILISKLYPDDKLRVNMLLSRYFDPTKVTLDDYTWLKNQADNNNALAQLSYAQILFGRNEEDKAKVYLLKSVNNKYYAAYSLLAHKCFMVDKLKDSEFWYKSAIKLGCKKSKFYLKCLHNVLGR